MKFIKPLKQNSEKQEYALDPFFRKDKAGQDVFYPWGARGDGFGVTPLNKIAIKRFLCFAILAYSAIVVLVVLAHYNQNINTNVFGQAISSTMVLFGIIYMGIVWRVIENCKSYNQATEKHSILLTYLGVTGFQVTAILLALNEYDKPAWLYIAMGSNAVYILIVVIFHINYRKKLKTRFEKGN